MTFAARETSRTLGAPIALFLFTYGPGAGDVYAYTNAEDIVVYNGVSYLPAPIDNDAVQVSGALDKASIDLRLVKTLPIVSLFDPWPPSSVVTLRIFQGHVGESEFSTLWVGRVLNVATQVNDAVFTCEPISTSMRRSGLRGKYGYGCGHALYGPACKASQAAATISVTVQSVTSPYALLPTNWAASDQQHKYKNGIATWVDGTGHAQYRAIVNITSSTEIQLNGDCSSLVAGMSLSLSLGCDHTMNDCRDLHSNINNFGGQPWIPYKNPIGVTNNYT